MTIFDTFFASQWASVSGWVFLHFLWQGLAIASVLFVLQRPLARRSPNARYAASGMALLAMVAAPILTFSLLWEGGPSLALAPDITLAHTARGIES